MSDRLSEIRARVAAFSKNDDPYRTAAWALDDLEFALGEIERLKGEVVIEREHYDLICEQVNEAEMARRAWEKS